MKVYLPSWNGDFRLEAEGDRSILILHEPTAHERVVIGSFLTAAAKKGWWSGEAPAKGQPYAGTDMRLPLKANLALASKALIKAARPKDRTITAVKFSSGRLEVVEGATSGALVKIEATVAAAQNEEREAGAAAPPAVAASVKRPTPCCPQCLPGAIEPATEVLLSFLTPVQHENWQRERAILVEGGLSGHRYLIAHRHSPIAQRVGKICYDVDDGLVVHFHDWSVPPEEEVLAAKLILEHAEPWLRNEATLFGDPKVFRYKNPFGDGGDGTETSSLVNDFGNSMLKVFGMKTDISI
jgi:hypothetical protein